MTNEKDACPARGGNFRAWLPEVMHDGEWVNIPIEKVGVNGVPYPEYERGVLLAIGLCGFHQATCLAHGFAAAEAAFGRTVKVRVREYKVHYDIKAWKLEPEGPCTVSNAGGD